MAHKRSPSQHLYAEMEANVLKFYGHLLEEMPPCSCLIYFYCLEKPLFGHILTQNGLIIFKMDVPNTLHYSLLYNESKIGRVSF